MGEFSILNQALEQATLDSLAEHEDEHAEVTVFELDDDSDVKFFREEFRKAFLSAQEEGRTLPFILTLDFQAGKVRKFFSIQTFPKKSTYRFPDAFLIEFNR